MRWQQVDVITTGMVRWIGIGVLAAALLLSVARPLAAQSKPADEKGAAEGVLALKNPGLEEGDTSPVGWITGAPLEGVEYVWDKSRGFKSKASVCIRKSGDKFFPIAMWSQTVPSTGKTTKLKVSAWVKADKAYKAVLDVGFVPADGDGTHQWAAYIGGKQKSDPPADHDWKEYSGVVAIPKDTKSIRIGLQVFGPGTVWFDTISAQYVPDDTPVTLYDDKGTLKLDQKP